MADTTASRQPVMKILFGPPGTGKTYQAAREAIRIIDGKVEKKKFANRHRDLVNAGRIWWVTFHPSYSYEDFVEGFRPELTDSGEVIYRPKDGPFKLACEACRSSDIVYRLADLFKVGELIGSSSTKYLIVKVDADGVLVTSKPSRGDAVTGINETYVAFWYIRRFIERRIEPKLLSVPGKDYRSGLKQKFAEKTGIAIAFTGNSGPYRAVYERVLAAIKGTSKPTSRPVVLIIDEINRADLSRVFGELITLIELDKRSGATEERSVILPYTQKPFTVPNELSIIGTMNTADRSLAVIDLALRRRFDFQAVDPNPGLCPGNYGGINIAELLKRWNRRITPLLSRDNRLGHSELMEVRLEEAREGFGWRDDDDGRRRALAWMIRHKVLPLLNDYFRNDWRMADIVFGRNTTSGTGGLLKEISFGEVAEMAKEVIDIADASSFEVPAWWDPEDDDNWDGERFAGAIMEVGST